MNIEDDIFRLLMIVLLLANEREGDKDNFLTDINQIVIIGLLLGTSRHSRKQLSDDSTDRVRDSAPRSDRRNLQDDGDI
jgi:hypothetical protein